MPTEPQSSAEDSPAKTSASPGGAPDSKAGGRRSTGKSSESFQPALFGLESSSSKMSPASFPLAAVVDAESAASFYAGIGDEAARDLRDALRARRPSGSESDTPGQTRRWSSPRWG